MVVLGLDLSKLLAELLVLAALHDDFRVADGAREAGVGHVAVELLRHALLTRQTQEQSVTGKQDTAGTHHEYTMRPPCHRHTRGYFSGFFQVGKGKK